MSKVYVVRSKTGCPHCVIAKEALASRGVEYVEEIYDDFDERQRMYDSLNLVGDQRTVPQVTLIIESPYGRTHQYIGGAKATVEHLEEEEAFA